VTSSYSSGGGGVVFEHDFSGVALAYMLVGEGVPGLGQGYRTVAVDFQSRTSAVDDLVVHGRSRDGTDRTLAVAIRSTPNIVASDERSATLFGDMLHLLNERAEDFARDRWRLALVAAGETTHMSELAELCDHARAQATADAFSDRATSLRRALRDRLRHVEQLCDQANESAGLAATGAWRVLRPLYIHSSGVSAEGLDAYSGVKDRLQRLLVDPHDVAHLWSHLRNLAAEFGPLGATVDEGVLRARLIGLVQLDASGLVEQAWQRLKRFDGYLRRRVNPGLGGGDRTLVLPRSALLNELATRLREPGLYLIWGEPDVGKSVATITAAQRLQDEGALAVVVSLTDLPESILDFEASLGVSLEELMSGAPVAPSRVLLIDGAEAVLQQRREMLIDICGAALSHGIGVGVVTRSDARSAVEEALARVSQGLSADASVTAIEVGGIDDLELEVVVDAFPSLSSVADETRGRILLRRLGLASLLLRNSGHGFGRDAPISEADIYRIAWRSWVRQDEVGSPDGASPDARERVLVEMARRELGADRGDVPFDDRALSSLRSDGLVQAQNPEAPWTGIRFASDLVRDLAVAHVLLASDFRPLQGSAAPRWALRASRLACSARLSNAQSVAGAEVESLQRSFDHVAASNGARWSDLPWEALLALRDSAIVAELLQDPATLDRVTRLATQHLMSHGGIVDDPETVEPIVAFLAGLESSEMPRTRGLRDRCEELIWGWLSRIALNESHEQFLETLEVLRESLLAHRLGGREDVRLELLASLGPAMDEGVKIELRRVAADRPDLLARAADSTLVAHTLSRSDCGLLIELAESYFIDESERSRAGRGSPLGDGIRHHRNPEHSMWPAWNRGPFWWMLNERPRDAVKLINRMLDHAARHRMAAVGDAGGTPQLTVVLPGVGERAFIGDAHVWAWYRGGTIGPYPCMSALMALERFADHLVGLGIELGRIVALLLEGAGSCALAGLIVGFLNRHLDRVTDELDPWLAVPEVWHLEFVRFTHEGSGLVRADDATTVGADRRNLGPREASMELVLRSVAADDQSAIERLGAVADSLEEAAIGRNEIEAATIASWASALRADRLHIAQAEDDRFVVSLDQAPEVVEILGPGLMDLQRGQESLRLVNHYGSGGGNGFDQRDIEVAQALASAVTTNVRAGVSGCS